MTEISQGKIEQAIQTTCTTVLRNELYFSDLDGLAGDGDFGTSLATGFRQIEAEWDGIPKTDIGAMLLKISMIVSKHVGGSSGPIWGTGFMKAAIKVASLGRARPTGRLLGGKVPRSPLRWEMKRGPWFDNNLAIVELQDERLHFWWSRGRVDGDVDRPRLERVATVDVPLPPA